MTKNMISVHEQKHDPHELTKHDSQDMTAGQDMTPFHDLLHDLLGLITHWSMYTQYVTHHDLFPLVSRPIDVYEHVKIVFKLPLVSLAGKNFILEKLQIFELTTNRI